MGGVGRHCLLFLLLGSQVENGGDLVELSLVSLTVLQHCLDLLQLPLRAGLQGLQILSRDLRRLFLDDLHLYFLDRRGDFELAGFEDGVQVFIAAVPGVGFGVGLGECAVEEGGEVEVVLVLHLCQFGGLNQAGNTSRV